MQVGINYPWIDYGWDFGDPPAAWIARRAVDLWREQKRERILADLESFASTGISLLRWFVLGDGTNYGMGDDGPGQDARTGRWTFQALPPGHPFYTQLADDFEFALQALARVGIRLVPSLIDFHWCRRAKVAYARDGIIKGGRSEVILDEVERAAFFDNVLESLLAISLRYADTIYAWELMNEPEWVTRLDDVAPSGIERQSDLSIPKQVMLDFMREGIERINRRRLPDGSRAFRSTIGFAHWDTLDEWDSSGLGVTLHQFHYYARRDRALPPHNFSPESPCFIGEFATAAERSWPELRRAGLPQTVLERLRCIDRKGFPSAFLWSARALDPATQWTRVEQDDVLGYQLWAVSRPTMT